MKTLLGALAVATTVLASSRSNSQATDSIPRVMAPLAELRPYSVIRFSNEGRYGVGRFARATVDSLFLTAAVVPIATLDSVWIRRRNTRQATIIGAYIGGGLFALVGLSLAADACQMGFGACVWFGSMLFGATTTIGVGAGGLVGMGIGVLQTVWRPVHP